MDCLQPPSESSSPKASGATVWCCVLLPVAVSAVDVECSAFISIPHESARKGGSSKNEEQSEKTHAQHKNGEEAS